MSASTKPKYEVLGVIFVKHALHTRTSAVGLDACCCQFKIKHGFLTLERVRVITKNQIREFPTETVHAFESQCDGYMDPISTNHKFHSIL